MIDRNSQFMAILTNVGAAKLANANALGIPWNLTALGVGDANGTDPIPAATQTKLINEQRRAPLNQLRIDPVNAAVIIAEQIIPADIGGWWIREVGLYDGDGDLVAVSNCAPSFKPSLDQGSGRTQIVRMNFIVSSVANIVLKIDPAVVLATREYVELAIAEAINKQDFKASVLVATTASITLTGLKTIDGVAVAAGGRILVKNQTLAKENGLWVAAAGPWSRAKDADSNSEVTSGMVVVVEQGATQADTLWQLVTDGPINVGVTDLLFKNITAGFAPIDSPAFIGAPRAPTPLQFDSSTRLATMEALQRASGNYRGEYAVEATFTLTSVHLGQIGYVIGDGGYTIKLPLTAGMAAGVTVRLLNRSLATITLASSSGPISGALLTSEGAVSMRRSATIELYWNGSAWVVFGGTEAISYAGFAPLASPNFTGTPTAPTAPAGTNNQQLATTAYTWLALNTYATTVTASLSLKANVDSPGFTGVPTAPTAAVGTSTKQLATAEFVQAALAAIDPWAMVPVGSYVPLHDVGTVPAPSRTSPFYKYIRLTASDGYNNPILVSESVSGTAPELIATGVVSLAGSPLNGVRISLINTERRTLKAGLPGVVEQDALQNITGTFGGAEASPSTTGAFSNGGWFGSVAAGGNTRNVLNFDASLVVRTAAETRVKSLGVTYYLRVK